jgi:hypothetical protein
MKTLLFALLLSTTFVLAQDAKPAASPSENHDHNKDWITVQGCVSRTSGDYILMKQNPPISYELQESGKIRLHSYMGQRVEVRGEQFPTLSTSSDSLNKTGSASAVTITVHSIRTIDKECPLR